MDAEKEGVFRVRHKESSFNEIRQLDDKSVSIETETNRNSMGNGIIFWLAVAAAETVAVTAIVLVAHWCSLYGGFAWNSDPNLQFFLHPLLMVLGLIVFYGNSIMSYRILYFLPKWILKLIHAALHLSAIVLSSVGLTAVFENHRRTGKADLYSLHSWVGIVTFSLFCLQFVVSFITFLFPGMPATVRARVMPFHTYFGIGIFLLAVCAAQMGLTERLLWTKDYTSNKYTEQGVVGNILGLMLIVFAFLVVFIVTHRRYKRRLLPTDISPTN